jgi:type II secretory pathway pseudopilin PulG
MTSDPIPTRRKRFPYGEIIVGVLIIMALAGLSSPVILKSAKAADRTEALNNIRQIGMSLFEFDNDYGNFPDDTTANEVRKRTQTDFKLTGEFSNDYFRQLIARGLKSEKPFWCKTSFSPEKPDDNFKTSAKTLAAGEVGFSYIMANATQGQSSSGDPGRPVVVAASYQARADWTFDPAAFGEKAIVLKLDNSATSMNIRADNKFISTGVAGRYLQTIGDNTPWGADMNPTLRAPQPKRR